MRSGFLYRAVRLQSCVLALGFLACTSMNAGAQGVRQYEAGSDVGESAQISNYVREVFQDREGRHWFGTNDDGVARFDGESLTFFTVRDGFGGNAVRGIVQGSDGDMWFATDGGVSRLRSGKFTNYTTKHGLSHNQVWCLMQDREGTIWAGTQRGVCAFDGSSFIPLPIPSMKKDQSSFSTAPGTVYAMAEDLDGRLWFGVNGRGVYRFDGESFASYSSEDGLASNDVRSICADRQGRVWIGSDGDGASCFEDGAWKNFTKDDGLSNNRIYEIYQDKAGDMWFSTLGVGASRYDGKTFTAFREDHDLMINGFPARGHVQEFYEDQDGVLWIGCSGGLFRFDGASFVNVKRGGPWPQGAEMSEPVDSSS